MWLRSFLHRKNPTGKIEIRTQKQTGRKRDKPRIAAAAGKIPCTNNQA